jgi:S1-C subfamily serine protease
MKVFRGFVLCLLLALAGSASADFESGLRAHDRGDYGFAHWEWLLLAHQGDAPAQYNLGSTYYNGESGPPDYARAAEWYRRAATQGHVGAQFVLGLMAHAGRGLPPDPAEAARWFRLAAEQGHPRAQHNLGILYHGGRGVPRDLTEAARWFLRAAEQGYPAALVRAAIVYHNGEGVAPDPVQAYKWYALAAQRLAGSDRQDAERLMQVVRGGMTGEQRARAERLAREWRPRPESHDRAAVWPRSLARDLEVPRGRAGVPAAPETGTGLVVDAAGHVLTSTDTLEGCRELRAVLPAGQRLAATVVARDAASRLALLRMAGPAPPAAPGVAPALGPVSELARAVTGLVPGPGGLSRGRVSPAATNRARPLLQVMPAVAPARHGAPLLDEAGNVLGVVVGGADAPAAAGEAVSFAVPAHVARDFLESHGVAADLAPAVQALSPTALEERARMLTVVVECRR